MKTLSTISAVLVLLGLMSGCTVSGSDEPAEDDVVVAPTPPSLAPRNGTIVPCTWGEIKAGTCKKPEDAKRDN
jgi:hypothetical protein